MFVIITDEDPNGSRIVDEDRSDLLCNLSVWISQYLLQKWCSLSNSYFDNARSRYRHIPFTVQKPVQYKVDRKYWATCGYTLNNRNGHWRWMSCGGYFYDYDCIPIRYRSVIPYKREILEYARVQRIGNNRLNKQMIVNHIKSESAGHDYYYYKECGFDDSLSKSLCVATEWLRFVIWVVRHNLYAIYGFDEQDFYTQCIDIIKEKHIQLLSTVLPEKLQNSLCIIPEDEEKLHTLVLRLCGKRRRIVPKNE